MAALLPNPIILLVLPCVWMCRQNWFDCYFSLNFFFITTAKYELNIWMSLMVVYVCGFANKKCMHAFIFISLYTPCVLRWNYISSCMKFLKKKDSVFCTCVWIGLGDAGEGGGGHLIDSPKYSFARRFLSNHLIPFGKQCFGPDNSFHWDIIFF